MKPAGKLIILLLVAGFAYGGWRLYQRMQPAGATGTSAFRLPLPGGGGGGGAELTLVTSATKKGWLEEQAERFNAENAGKAHVKIQYLESRDALQAVLNGKVKPVLWSPSSPVWAARLNDAWSLPQFHHDGQQAPIRFSDPNAYRVYMRTPIVFLTTQAKARALHPFLSGTGAWRGLRNLTTGRQRLPGHSGPVRFAHSDPATANSGFLTVGLMLNAYTEQTGTTAPLEEVAKSAGFAQFLADIDRTASGDRAVAAGSSALTQAFLDYPDRYDVIATYESSALEAVRSRSDLAVLYPSPTVAAEQSVAVLQGDWVTPEQKQAAAAFLTFLGGDDAMREGINAHFRPETPTGDITLAPELSRFRSNGFQQTFTAVELPPYLAMNDAAAVWRNRIARTASNR